MFRLGCLAGRRAPNSLGAVSKDPTDDYILEQRHIDKHFLATPPPPTSTTLVKLTFTVASPLLDHRRRCLLQHSLPTPTARYVLAGAIQVSQRHRNLANDTLRKKRRRKNSRRPGRPKVDLIHTNGMANSQRGAHLAS